MSKLDDCVASFDSLVKRVDAFVARRDSGEVLALHARISKLENEIRGLHQRQVGASAGSSKGLSQEIQRKNAELKVAQKDLVRAQERENG